MKTGLKMRRDEGGIADVFGKLNEPNASGEVTPRGSPAPEPDAQDGSSPLKAGDTESPPTRRRLRQHSDFRYSSLSPNHDPSDTLLNSVGCDSSQAFSHRESWDSALKATSQRSVELGSMIAKIL